MGADSHSLMDTVPRSRLVFGVALIGVVNWGQIPILLAEPVPLADTPPSASRFAPMLSGDAPAIGAANQICARKCCRYPHIGSKANLMARQEFRNRHLTETDTSGCAGRRHRSAATGGDLHAPRWRFASGSSSPTHQRQPKTDTSGCAGRRHRSAATGGGLHAPRWRFARGSSAHPKGQINPT